MEIRVLVFIILLIIGICILWRIMIAMHKKDKKYYKRQLELVEEKYKKRREELEEERKAKIKHY